MRRRFGGFFFALKSPDEWIGYAVHASAQHLDAAKNCLAGLGRLRDLSLGAGLAGMLMAELRCCGRPKRATGCIDAAQRESAAPSR